MDIEVEGIIDVLVRSAESDADGLEHPPDAEELEGVATQAVGADHPDLGETTGASITDERTTTRSLLQRDGAGDAVILVMPEDDNTRFRRETAGQGGALVENGMAVTLFIGGDAGVGGDVANGIGQDDLQRDGKRSGRYEGSGGAGRSRRGGRREGVKPECAAAPPGQIQDLRGQDRPRRVELAQADNGCDAMPGRIALTFEATEIGGGDCERAVIEELADRLHRLADIAAELGGGMA